MEEIAQVSGGMARDDAVIAAIKAAELFSHHLITEEQFKVILCMIDWLEKEDYYIWANDFANRNPHIIPEALQI